MQTLKSNSFWVWNVVITAISFTIPQSENFSYFCEKCDETFKYKPVRIWILHGNWHFLIEYIMGRLWKLFTLFKRNVKITVTKKVEIWTNKKQTNPGQRKTIKRILEKC